MHLSPLLTIALGALATNAIPLESSAAHSTPEMIQDGPFPLARPKSTAAPQSELPATGLEKRADKCGGGFGSYNTADANELQRQLQNYNPEKLAYLPAWSSISWSIGTAKVCAINMYLSDNTHVKEWEVGWGMGYVRDKCCGGKSSCTGGICSGHGDTGLSVDFRVQNSARSCEW
ncbi:uncharacterized protein LY79DRAFT_534708 [Colletotrichum navitas]|uniref:Uncharacterized protein n=1 Tax=Colletotrichum navitas TaxID=681940 RepID=A0AAD8QB46_9PEZI|nr:uncharacterized protein LY79DRAFT_534708 [Colletotrichum navitas]KAK1599302.1 hypothetical protein LY79DRAFT_534708 [Colletotrichum navitas]